MGRLRQDDGGVARRITYDWSGPEDLVPGPGDYLATISRRTDRPTGTAYGILAARRVRQTEDRPFARMAYTVVRVDLDDIPVEARVEGLVWHRR